MSEHSNHNSTNFNEIIVKAIIENTEESIYFKDLNSKFTLLSQYHVDYFGAKSMNDCIGKSDFDYFTKEHAQQAYNDEQEIIRTGKPILGKIEQETWEDNYVSYVVTSKYPLYDSNNQIIGVWGHSINVATTNNNNQDLKQEKITIDMVKQDFSQDSRLDSLTNLKNAKAFYEIMNLFYQEAMNTISVPGKEHILVLVDMNDFKSINSNFGHKYGDKALSFASMLLKKVESNKAHLFRYGSDEFAFLIEKHTYDEAIELTHAILDLFSKYPFNGNNETISLAVSIGMSRFKESLPFGNIHDIINLTDKRLYAAKKLDQPTVIYDNSYRF